MCELLGARHERHIKLFDPTLLQWLIEVTSMLKYR